MKKAKIKAIIDAIDKFAEMGVINSDEHTALKKAVLDLLHALSVKNYSLIEKAAGRIAKLLLKVG